MAEDVEVFFPVGVAVAGVVAADGFAFKGGAGGLVEAGGEGVGEGVAFGGVAGPAGGGVPAGAVSGRLGQRAVLALDCCPSILLFVHP